MRAPSGQEAEQPEDRQVDERALIGREGAEYPSMGIGSQQVSDSQIGNKC